MSGHCVSPQVKCEGTTSEFQGQTWPVNVVLMHESDKVKGNYHARKINWCKGNLKENPENSGIFRAKEKMFNVGALWPKCFNFALNAVRLCQCHNFRCSDYEGIVTGHELYALYQIRTCMFPWQQCGWCKTNIPAFSGFTKKT